MVDTMITLYESTESQFLTNGLGGLPDAMTCVVSEERNGIYELEMDYPVTGIRFNELKLRRIIYVKPNPYTAKQPFRIYSISKEMGGVVTIEASHISYDLSGYPVSAFEAESTSDAIVKMRANVLGNCPFTITSDIDEQYPMTNPYPNSYRSLIGGTGNSIISLYGGECEFDGYNIAVKSERGSNRGVSIRYGKNLTDLTQDENCANVATAVYPFWYSEEEGYLELPEKTVNAPGTYDFVRILPLDLTEQLNEEWQGMPEVSALREMAEEYVETNKIGIPKVSLKVSFEDLGKYEEYSEFALLHRVHLCDTVNVAFPELNVDATAKCISTKYDALSDRYSEITLGESQANLVSNLVAQNGTAAKKTSKTALKTAIEHVTQQITGGLGGYVVMHSSSGGTQPDEILIMDNPDIETAVKVWRWNKNGLGFSDHGYNGPYETAITQDGNIVADFITTGELSANLITAGTLSADRVDGGVLSGVSINIADGNFTVDPDGNVTLAGDINLSDGTIDWGENTPVKYQFSVNGTTSWHTVMTSSDKYRRDSLDGGDSWGDPYQFRGVNGSDANVSRRNVERALAYASNLDGSFMAVDSAGAPVIYGGKIYGAEIYAGGSMNNDEVEGTGSVISLTNDGIEMRSPGATPMNITTVDIPSMGKATSVLVNSGTLLLNGRTVYIAHNPGMAGMVGLMLNPYGLNFYGDVNFSNADVTGLTARFG